MNNLWNLAINKFKLCLNSPGCSLRSGSSDKLPDAAKAADPLTALGAVRPRCLPEI